MSIPKNQSDGEPVNGMLFYGRDKRLAQLRIGRVRLLGKG